MLIKLERQKVDEEWAKVQEAEKAAFLHRARMLQLYEDPRVRALNSQLLMSNFLKVTTALISGKGPSVGVQS